MIKRIVAAAGEKCHLCDRELPPGITALKKVENNRIVCILCLVEIAEIAKSERT